MKTYYLHFCTSIRMIGIVQVRKDLMTTNKLHGVKIGYRNGRRGMPYLRAVNR